MSTKAQFLLVAPKNLGPGLDGRSRQQLVKIGYLILAMIPHQDQHGTLPGNDGAFEQGSDPGIELLTDHCTELTSAVNECNYPLASFNILKIFLRIGARAVAVPTSQKSSQVKYELQRQYSSTAKSVG
mmetsp:Transcript_20730/g.44835  ORF Transcript_20730/g.44835 Transcript_20730/m.44835 type:complete len:128 (-) Transcript_20730:287-670(-)